MRICYFARTDPHFDMNPRTLELDSHFLLNTNYVKTKEKENENK